MHSNQLFCALVLLLTTPAYAAQAVTNSEADTGGEPSGTVTFVEPADNSVILGTPDAMVKVVVEFSGAVANVDLTIDGGQPVNCPNANASQCVADVMLSPGQHTITGTGTDTIGLAVLGANAAISVEVTAEAATTGGASTDGSTGDSSGEPDPDKGCNCDANGHPAPGLALVAGLAVLARRRRTRTPRESA